MKKIFYREIVSGCYYCGLFINKVYNKILLSLQDVQISPGYKVNGRLFISNKGEIKIGNNFKANSGISANPIGGDTVMRLTTKKKAAIIIGNNVGISNSTIVSWSKVEIGDYVYIGGGCKIWDTDFHSIDPYERRHNGDGKVNSAPIKIKNYAFIGGSSIILKGVTVGEYSVIGAGSVVVKSVPDKEVWGGNPAKFIRKIEAKEFQTYPLLNSIGIH